MGEWNDWIYAVLFGCWIVVGVMWIAFRASRGTLFKWNAGWDDFEALLNLPADLKTARAIAAVEADDDDDDDDDEQAAKVPVGAGDVRRDAGRDAGRDGLREDRR
ncbi:MAG: hypothetical protein H6729_06440 [Deltaproteobacteria bacterium]|nr:hypothetical protein [Deltaproteobacteria bacterium]